MPPLCVTGISFAASLGAAPLDDRSGAGLVYGSVLLWLANLAAINLAAILIFLLVGMSREADLSLLRRRFLISATLVLLLTFPLLAFLQQTVTRSRDERLLRESLTRFSREVLDREAELVSFRLGRLDPEYGWRPVMAMIYSPRLPDRDEVLALRDELEGHLGQVDLKLTVNPVHTYRENAMEGSISDRPLPVDQ